MSELELIEERAYKTFKARLKSSERLALLDRSWNFALVVLATSTSIASVGLLSDPDMYGSAGPTILTVLAVLALVASLVVSGQRYGARSRDMFTNYRRLQKVASQAEALRLRERAATPGEVVSLAEAFNVALDDSENHTTDDYRRAFPARKWNLLRITSFAFVIPPAIATVGAVLVLIPFMIWAFSGSAA